MFLLKPWLLSEQILIFMIKKTAVGLEINANHIRPVPEGTRVIGVSKPLHRGSKIQVWETKITTEERKLACISRCTLAIVDSWI